MVKNFLFFLIALFFLTQGVIMFHSSKYEKSEYDRICNSLYDEKVWIDTCYIPYNSEISTFTLVRNIEIAGIVVSGAILLSKVRPQKLK